MAPSAPRSLRRAREPTGKPSIVEQYNRDPAKYRVAVHPAAQWIRDELFRRALARPTEEGSNRVVFTAGGNASGKTSTVAASGAAAGAQVVLDSTFSNLEHAGRLVNDALEAGKEVTIHYVNRPLEDALRGMLERAGAAGRVVSIDQLIRSQRGAAETVRGLWDRYRTDPRVGFYFLDNSAAKTSEGGIETAVPQNYTESRQRLNELLDPEYEEKRIAEAAYRRIRGPGAKRGESPAGSARSETGGGGTEPASGAKTAEGETTPAGTDRRPLESSHASKVTAEPERPARQREEVPGPRRPGNPVAYGAETEVFAEGRTAPYSARYAVRELSDTYPSHNPFSFEPNPEFHYINDRDYSLPANKSRVVSNSGTRFRPVKVINDNPDAINGPSVIEPDGNVLGGNNRRMTLERVYSQNPKGAAEYRALLMAKASQFGVDPAAIERMKQPVLVRELNEADLDPQRAITEFNYSPAGGHSVGERAAADARGMTPETGKYLGAVMEGAGPDATLTDVLNSKRGPEVVNSPPRSILAIRCLPSLVAGSATATWISSGASKARMLPSGGGDLGSPTF